LERRVFAISGTIAGESGAPFGVRNFGGKRKMVSSIVLLNVAHGRINEVAERLAALDGISEVYSVAGRYDLVAVLRVPNNEALAELVTETMLHIDGIVNSETLIAFRVFSRHDLESMFSIGLD
jgi:DNA-binding Lrp family transcriptional regulator